MSKSNLNAFVPSMVALAAALSCGAAMAQASTDVKKDGKTVELGEIKVVGEAERVGNGKVVREDAVKARSNVTRESLSKERSTTNPFQAMSLNPGVSTFSHDATGMFGGGFTLRGFNSDQIGFTVNGVPVNDSGTFAVYPQEYADVENTCAQSVTQGSTDIDSPHVGATGGNVAISTCDPERGRRLRFAQTVGGLGLSKSFFRVDTGKIGDVTPASFFFSASHSEVNKWKGAGRALRDHIDAGLRWDLGKGNVITGSVLYNKAINHNFASITRAEYNTFGYYFDNLKTFPGVFGKTPGAASDDRTNFPLTANSTSSRQIYYGLSQNPFENAVLSLNGSFKLNSVAQLKIQPYYWFGYGTGGLQQTFLSETNTFWDAASGKKVSKDLNGDGDTRDTVLVANSSITRTDRPGVTVTLVAQLGNQTLTSGVWLERAQHRQTGTAVPVGADGNPVDVWLMNGAITRPDGTLYQSRNWMTVSTAAQVFLQDSVNLMNDRLNVTVGVRTPYVKRDFTNYPNEGSGVATSFYHFAPVYKDVLPQLGFRFQINDENQIFANAAKNFRAPPNFAYAPNNFNVKRAADGTISLALDPKPETSKTLDLGYRYQSGKIIGQATAFLTNYKDRQANVFDPVLANSVYANAGDVHNRGLELEAGAELFKGFNVYGSFTYTKSEILSDLVLSKTETQSTKGKAYPLVPKYLAGLSAQYHQDNWYVNVKGKRQGGLYTTFQNNDFIGHYYIVDVDAGIQFRSMGMFKRPLLKVSIANLNNARYLSAASAQTAATSVRYYTGAPRMVQTSLQFDL